MGNLAIACADLSESVDKLGEATAKSERSMRDIAEMADRCLKIQDEIIRDLRSIASKMRPMRCTIQVYVRGHGWKEIKQ